MSPSSRCNEFLEMVTRLRQTRVIPFEIKIRNFQLEISGKFEAGSCRNIIVCVAGGGQGHFLCCFAPRLPHATRHSQLIRHRTVRKVPVSLPWLRRLSKAGRDNQASLLLLLLLHTSAAAESGARRAADGAGGAGGWGKVVDMFYVQSSATGSSPPLIQTFWDACPFFNDGVGMRAGGGGSSSNGKTSARLLRCFVSLSSSPPLPPSCSANEDRGIRQRRTRVEARSQVSGMSSGSSSSSSAPAAIAAAAAAPAEVLPEWLGGLGLDKEEEEGLVAAFAALPEPPPPAAADARLVQAARDLVVSMKDPVGRRRRAESKDPAEQQFKRNGNKQARGAAGEKAPFDVQGEQVELQNEQGGWIEVRGALGADKISGAKRPAKESMTPKAAKARDAWMQQRLRLDDKALAKMTEICPHILKHRTREDIAPKLDWLQKELALDDHVLGKVVSSAPAILRLDEGGIRPKLEWMKRSLGLDRRGSAKLLVAVPTLLYLSEETLEKKLAFLGGEELNLTRTDVKRIVRHSPAVLSYSIDENMRPKLAWLRERFGLDAGGLRKMVGRSPRVLSLKAETIEGKMMWLEGRLGMDRERAVKVVSTFPVILSMALDTMDWKLLWLQQRLSLTQEQMMAMVVKYPILLSYSIEDNLEPTIKWLEEDLGMDSAAVGTLVMRQPRLLSANLEDNLKNKVPWLMENLGLARDVVLEVIIGCPDILNLNTERNLGPTIQFFYDEMGASREEVSEMVAASGKPLMYSLEKRWRPRVARIRNLGVTPCFRDHWKAIAMRVPASFDAWLEALPHTVVAAI